ncbi:MAG TPA: hypothetical protein VJT15_10000 [Pyrinomonadaceae bacterium]|nr:hypothetical protein [Pyrinomonadaceae bacterium]
MRVKFLHTIGALILMAVVFSSVAMLGAGTAQAAKHVTIVPRVYIGPQHHHHRYHHHYRHHHRW